MDSDAPTKTVEAVVQTVDADFPPGTLFGRYVLLEALGKGGMGAVYAAYDSELDRRVALKLLRIRTSGLEAEEWRGRMMREAKAMARLSHPNVVTLFDVGVSKDEQVFLAMEMVDGGTLKDWLAARPRTWREIVAILCEAGEGLAAAHSAGIIHRDFKLDNVLLGKDGRAKVTDFGLARGAELPFSGTLSGPNFGRVSVPGDEPPPSAASASHSASSLARVTMTGAVMGTPGYMAPEQYMTDFQIDARADVFAFCATLHRALYGKRAFAGETLEEIADATIAGRVEEAPKGNTVPPWVRRVVLWGLAVDRSARPASMRALLAALRADPARRRWRWLAAAGALAVAAAVAIGARAAGEQRVRACRATADRLAGVWDGSRKEAIARAFVATGLPYAADTWEHAEKRLDAYAAAWASASAAACEATRVRGEQSETMLDRRASCLDERLDELRALGDVLAAADAKTVDHAVQAATTLPSLEPCANVDRLSAAARLPAEPKARAEIRALQQDVAAANELRLTGKHTQSRERLEGARARVEAARYGPLSVAWTMALANADHVHDPKAAAAEWERAIALSDTYRLDRERAEALLGLALVLDDLARHDESLRALAFAGATLERIGGDPELEVTHDVYEGMAEVGESRFADAARAVEHALSRAKEANVDNPVRIADAHSFLALALLHDPARFSDALEHAHLAIAIDEEAYGRQNPAVGAMEGNLGLVEEEVGRFDDALATAKRCLAIFEAGVARGDVSAQNVNLGAAFLETGEVQVRMGRPRDALELLEKARAIFRGDDEAEGLVDADRSIAEVWRQLGRLDDASREAGEARSIVGDGKDTEPELYVQLLNVEAKIAIDRGWGPEAMSLAERAVKSAESGVSRLYDLSDAHLALARALLLTRGDLALARALAEQARDGFAKLGVAWRVNEAQAVIAGMR